ncbi:MAG: hypothetical protein GPJ21_06755 [Microcystis aeruginosa W13-11]|nr:hypothetical protein [Microcystis aeruginosa W13-11]
MVQDKNHSPNNHPIRQPKAPNKPNKRTFFQLDDCLMIAPLLELNQS